MATTLNVSRGGVEVYKSVMVEDAPVPTVLYVVGSDRDEPVTVRLIDDIPEGIPSRAIAVHDAYDAKGWRVHEDGCLEYSRQLEPGETRKTAFFVKVDPEDADRFFVAPSIEDVRSTEHRTVAP